MYSTILFDIDGVLLSEERYFDASALTVYEMLTSHGWLNVQVPGLPSITSCPSDDTIQMIRAAVFHHDHVLDFMKSRGVNANWDMVYLQFMYQWSQLLKRVSADAAVEWDTIRELLRGTWELSSIQAVGNILSTAPLHISIDDFASFSDAFVDCTDRAGMFSAIRQQFRALLGKPSGDLLDVNLHAMYDLAVDAFQAWYLGDEYFEGPKSGKIGFVQQEIPLQDPAELSRLFEMCIARGATLGIATGRPEIETKVPFHGYGWDRYFASDRISTATDVRAAEQANPALKPLSKPHPYSYLRSWMGAAEAERALNCPLPLPEDAARDILIVGDSVADWQAAKVMGCHFAAVLTGLTGEQARSSFETLGCNYIVDTVLDLKSALSL